MAGVGCSPYLPYPSYYHLCATYLSIVDGLTVANHRSRSYHSFQGRHSRGHAEPDFFFRLFVASWGFIHHLYCATYSFSHWAGLFPLFLSCDSSLLSFTFESLFSTFLSFLRTLFRNYRLSDRTFFALVLSLLFITSRSALWNYIYIRLVLATRPDGILSLFIRTYFFVF